jgi:hypothetical protein
MTVRLGLVLTVLALPAGAAAEPAREVPPLPETVVGSRTVLHYTTTGADAISAAEGMRLAAAADATIPVGLEGAGFPPPPDDGDGRIDVYVHVPEARFAGGAEPAGYVKMDEPLTLRTGYVVVAPSVARQDDIGVRRTLVHEANHLAQLALTPAARTGVTWLREATAQWAAFAVDRPAAATAVPGLTPYLADTASPLDCEAVDPCNATNLDQGGYARWHVLAQLDKAFGPGLVRAWWDEIARQPSWPRGVEIAALSTVLAARRATLGEGFTALAAGNLAGLDLPSTAGVRPKAGALLSLAKDTQATIARPVDHLAIDNVGLTAAGCAAGRIQLEVDVPAAAGTRAVYWQAGGSPVVLITGRADLPWRGCRRAMVSLPNGSPTTDDLPFALRATLRPVVPVVTGLRVRRRTAVFVVNVAVRLRLRVERRANGRWAGVASLRPAARAGTNRVSLVRALAQAGRYRVSVTPPGGRVARVALTVGRGSTRITPDRAGTAGASRCRRGAAPRCRGRR